MDRSGALTAGTLWKGQLTEFHDLEEQHSCNKAIYTGFDTDGRRASILHATTSTSTSARTGTTTTAPVALNRLLFGRALILGKVLVTVRLFAAVGLVLALSRSGILRDASTASTGRAARSDRDLDASELAEFHEALGNRASTRLWAIVRYSFLAAFCPEDVFSRTAFEAMHRVGELVAYAMQQRSCLNRLRFRESL